MKENHFLLTKAYIYPKEISISDPKDCEYCLRVGVWFWRFNNLNLVLVKSSNPRRPDPHTKKHDIETGEDLKGE